MKKIFILISLLLLLIPIALGAQFDSQFYSSSLIDNTLDLLDNNPDSESEITLKTLELYWSADTYVPFGYQGRPLATTDSPITVNAYLEVSGENPKNLKYSWFVDDIFQELKSGYGRDSFRFQVRRVERLSHNVRLIVFNESRSFVAEKTITIPIASPDLVVYLKNDSPFNLAYTTSAKNFRVIPDKENLFIALPYFFNIKTLSDLEFEWLLGEKSTKESSLVANIFDLKIINKETKGMLEDNLIVNAVNKNNRRQQIQKILNIHIY